ncbi:MAG: SH3 domain-containing protein [Candidatus Thiodiazotropha sp. (ex Monitilora ramsayi)]|nr:SH3 domain-containing protein [Candidatus Thiodiazotropha sp. (ex Monitilora ramsayi)]
MRPLLMLCVFLLTQFMSQSVLSEADGPDYWAVTGITENSYLNLRKGPSKAFSVVGRIPGNYKKLENLGCYPNFTFAEWEAFDSRERELAMMMRWCKVRYLNSLGWVYAKYLVEGGDI